MSSGERTRGAVEAPRRSSPGPDDPIEALDPSSLLRPLLGMLARILDVRTVADLAEFDSRVAALIQGVGKTRLAELEDLQDRARRICDTQCEEGDPLSPRSVARSEDPIAVLAPPALLSAVLDALGRQMGVRSIADLAALDLAIAKRIKGIGRRKLKALGELRDRALKVCDQPLRTGTEAPNPSFPVTQLGELLVAAHYLTGATTLADLPCVDWQVLLDATGQDVTTPLEDLVPTSFAFFDVPLVVRTALGRLGEREREILIRTALAPRDDRDTLESIGDDFSVTRERIRQIRIRALSTFDAITSPVLGRIAPWLVRLAGQASRVSSLPIRWNRLLVQETNEEARRVCVSAMRRAAGYAVGADGWARTESAEAALRGAQARLLEAGQSRGIVPNEAIANILDGHIAFDDERDAFLKDVVGLTSFEGRWVVNGSAKTRVRAALAILGGPATKAEIGQLTGLDPSRVGSYLSAIPGVCRADKERWAYEEWVDDPYDGIVGEILQRIEEDGGSTTLERLVRELPEMFAVSEVSVRAYLATPRFVIEGATVREASEAEIAATHYGHVKNVATAVRLDDGTWAARLAIEQRHLDGYSAGLPAPVARAAGLEPGESLLVEVEGFPHAVSLSWRLESLTRLVALGRLAPVLASLNVSPGDELVVAPGRERIRIFRAEEAPIDAQARPGGTPQVEVQSVLDELFRR